MGRMPKTSDSWARPYIPRQDGVSRRFKVGDRVRPVLPIGHDPDRPRGWRPTGTIVGTADAVVSANKSRGKHRSFSYRVDTYVVRWDSPQRVETDGWTDASLVRLSPTLRRRERARVRALATRP